MALHARGEDFPLGVASVVRKLTLRPGQVASGSVNVRVRWCGPRYTG